MNFEKITNEEMELAKAKFMEHGRGLIATNHVQRKYSSNSPEANELLWTDLINPSIISMRGLRNIMRNHGRKMSSIPDPLLVEDDIAFVHITPIEDKVSFTHEECYLLARAALIVQQSNKEVVALREEAKEAQKFLDDNKTLSEKRKEAQRKIEAAQKAGLQI